MKLDLSPNIRHDVTLGGNTVGALANISTGTMFLAGGANITLSQNANSVTISGGAGGAGLSAGLSNIGNTSGDTASVTGRLIFAGGNNITLSGSTNAGSMTITVSAGAGAGGTDSMGMSNLGNTSGTTGIVSATANRFLFAGGNNVTLSQSLNGASGTLTISGANAGAQNMNFWQNMGVNGSATDAMAQTGITYDQLQIFQLDIGNNIFAGNMTIKSVFIDMTASVQTSIPNYTVSCFFGLYSIETIANSLSLINSGSVSWGTSLASTGSTTTNHQSFLNGKRYISMNSSVFSTQLSMTQGLYYGGMFFRSSSNSYSMSMYGAILGESGQRSGTMGAASVTNTYIGAMPYMGVYQNTTTAFPVTIASGQIRKTAVADIFVPHIMFNNILATF